MMTDGSVIMHMETAEHLIAAYRSAKCIGDQTTMEMIEAVMARVSRQLATDIDRQEGGSDLACLAQKLSYHLGEV